MKKLNKIEQLYVDAHKPIAIDPEYLANACGSVMRFMESMGECENGVYRIEIGSFSSATGNPVIIEWGEKDYE